MMAGNPSWWSMHPPPPSQQTLPLLSSSPNSIFNTPQYVLASSPPSQSLPFNSSLPDHNQQLPQSWSQLLLGGLPPGEEDERYGVSQFQPKKFEINWEEQQQQQQQILNQNMNTSPNVPRPHHHHVLISASSNEDHVKQEIDTTQSNLYFHGSSSNSVHDQHHQFQEPPPQQQSRRHPMINSPTVWSSQVVLPHASSPRSCVTSSFCTSNPNNNNFLDFSYDDNNNNNNINKADQSSSECNSTSTGGICKKPRVHSSSGQPPLKVRKEKLGDRITALHQLVSPFGKTDTASVLMEAIGYIRFLQGQIEALSSPYMGTTSSSSNMRNQQSVQGERNGVFPEDPGQLFNDMCLKRKGVPQQDNQDKPRDLKSRGLCLVPLSCTHYVGSENGADYWAPAIGGGGF